MYKYIFILATQGLLLIDKKKNEVFLHPYLKLMHRKNIEELMCKIKAEPYLKRQKV